MKVCACSDRVILDTVNATDCRTCVSFIYFFPLDMCTLLPMFLTYQRLKFVGNMCKGFDLPSTYFLFFSSVLVSSIMF